MRKNNFIFYILFLGILVLAGVQQMYYFHFTTTLFGRETKRIHKIVPQTQSDFFASVDVIESLDGFIRIEGWASLQNVEYYSQRTFLVLSSQQDTIVLSTIPVGRPDVVSALKSDKYLFSGFKVIYPTCEVRPGKYQIGYLIEGSDSPRYKLTGSSVEFKAAPQMSVENCQKSLTLTRSDNISLLDFFFEDLRKYLDSARIQFVGYVGDSSSIYQITKTQVLYSLVPTLNFINEDDDLESILRKDTLISYFPKTRSLQHPQNPLYNQKEKWRILKDFGNGILVLNKRDSIK